MNILIGKKGLVIGIADEHSIAWGCAKAFFEAGAELVLTYFNEKTEENVRKLAAELNNSIVMKLDVQNEEQMQNLFNDIQNKWGKLDFVVHSVAFAPKNDLHGRVVDCSRAGFLMAMDISCYSFIRVAYFAEKLMHNGGCLLTMSYYGSEMVIENYNMMGPVKSALESSVKYLAAELGKKHIRVNALSPGPIQTRAAGGIDNFDRFVVQAKQKSPSHVMPTIEDVGTMATFLVSDYAKSVTGNITFIDYGVHIIG